MVISGMTTMTLAERRLAEQVWLRRTTLRQRRKVIKYLKIGQVHPDDDLARRVYRWAKGEGRVQHLPQHPRRLLDGGGHVVVAGSCAGGIQAADRASARLANGTAAESRETVRFARHRA